MAPLSRRSFLAASAGGLASPSFAAAQAAAPPAVEEAPFQPSTLFLTWRRDPTTTMVVQWVGTAGETADTRIYYAPANAAAPLPFAALLGAMTFGGSAPVKIQATTVNWYPKTDFKVFRAELTGLTPGTDYQFRIGKASPTYRFATMPAKATNSFSFISGGDCGVNAHAVANNIQAARQDPLFAVVGGDLGYDNGRSVEISLAFLRNYSRHMVAPGGRLIPLVPCIGNHEVDGGYGKTRANAPFFYALFDGLFPDAGFATLDFGQYLSLILLDTGHTTKIAGEQTAWLEAALKARADHPHVMVVNHVPAYPSYRKMAAAANGKEGTGEGNRKHWTPLFDKYRVPVVLEHHDHTFKRTRPLIDGRPDADGVLYLGDGSWGRLRPPVAPDKLPHLAATSMDYHLSLHRLQGEERFHVALDETGKLVDVCRSGQRRTGAVRVGG